MDKTMDLRVYKTRKALCETFLELMNEKSFDDITINELCERAFVRRATFYKHFMDKYDFFSYFIRYYRAEYIGDIAKNIEDSAPGSYCLYCFECLLTFVNENRTLIDNVLKSNMLSVIIDIFSDEIYAHMLELIQSNRLIDEQSNLSPEILSSFYSGGIIRVMYQWLKSPDRISEEELKKNMRTLMNAFG